MEVSEALPEYERYTYADYCAWGDEKRWELLDGVPYALSAPSQAHQEISGSLHNQIYNYLKGKSCKVFAAPFDVRLNADAGDDTIVQPDLLVVCDQAKLDGKCCVGAPDMVIEILSPSTVLRDRVLKSRQYLRAGIREYWIVDPDVRMVTVHVLQNGEYVAHPYSSAEAIPVSVLEGCVIDLLEVFGGYGDVKD